ncbi:HAD-like protein [Dothidotthia symphoricarpi CBS 119687]|uniref:HAD-like protein n=1 Tax=Dothidotthia symphoricarpi CBS 119687 TaxID=1392245 RepID=A0A6A6AJY1_9PLEO|nr:HAD-like protein [Dothidotthia symphoricarpi CBS 119687]KAF2131405.1 HAD-like protein [Dothidotthia symphoricarpi CBS 119687]
MTVPEPSFSAPAQTIKCHGLLFDMDGTIIDSTDAIVKHWHRIGKEIGVDPDVILATSHGRRSIDVLQIYEPKLANWEYICHAEGLIPKEFGEDAIEIPGSRAMLDSLDEQAVPWCIVTSGTRPLVIGWLDRMKLAHPKNIVTAEDVLNGKPDPACYQMGKDKLGLHKNSASIVVFEDAPAGIRSGKAAGYTVVALHTTHSLKQLMEAGADYIVQDMRSVTLKSWDSTAGEGQLEITNALT